MPDNRDYLMKRIETSIFQLKNYIESEEFKGYDPYDILNSKIPIAQLPKYLQAIAIQIHKRTPFSIRPILGIKKEYNPKGLGLLLDAYSRLYTITKNEELKKTAKKLFNIILSLRYKNSKEYCWGYNFPWANPQKVVPKYFPSIVVSSFIAKGIFTYYNTFKDDKAIEILKSISNYIIYELPRTETAHGICFSYSSVVKDTCFNATMLGSEVLAKTYSLTKNETFLQYAKDSVEFTLSYQKEDGKWFYSIDLETGYEDKQLDFHQGFILESLNEFIKYSLVKDKKYVASYEKGLAYYKKNLFHDNGKSLWRYPKEYPIEIHNQAQGIITFSNAKIINKEYLEFAGKIFNWTLKNMKSPKGFFYYRKYRYHTVKTSYIRWSQAWMLLALVTYWQNKLRHD